MDITTTMDNVSDNLRVEDTLPNNIIDGKLYIPRHQWDSVIKDGVEIFRFTYMDIGYYWRGPRALICTSEYIYASTLKEIAQILKIKGYSKLKKTALNNIVFKNIIFEGRDLCN